MSVTAKATITIEINCSSSWNDNTTIDQVRKQAIKDAFNALNKMQEESNGVFKVIGNPEIKIISFGV